MPVHTARRTLLWTAAAAAVYFALVFGAGFILGPIRVLAVAPRVGERIAELLEAPIMLTVIVLAARWIVGRFGRSGSPSWPGVGLLALGGVLAAEFAVLTFFWRMPLDRYLAARDPVGLAAYAALLVLLAAMPSVVARRRGRRRALP